MSEELDNLLNELEELIVSFPVCSHQDSSYNLCNLGLKIIFAELDSSVKSKVSCCVNRFLSGEVSTKRRKRLLRRIRKILREAKANL